MNPLHFAVALLAFPLSLAHPAALSTATVSASLRDYQQGYLQWEHHHPEARVPGKPYKLAMPAIDLYEPSGQSVYYGAGDGAQNASFLRSLSSRISSSMNSKPSVPRPTLGEAIAMFPELKDREQALLSAHEYTVFAVTYQDWPPSKKQNEAVAELRKSLPRLRIQLVEVSLDK